MYYSKGRAWSDIIVGILFTLTFGGIAMYALSYLIDDKFGFPMVSSLSMLAIGCLGTYEGIRYTKRGTLYLINLDKQV